ncbi:MAG TPA: GGDEF domain-containing protein [Paucimonas sp.]|nr:GGDEF domain-containing protein [Paucimonas sp.]
MHTSLYAEIVKTRLFADVSLDSVARLLDMCRVLAVPPGTVLIEQSENNDVVYVVLEGQLDVHLSGLEQPSFVTLGPGDCAGEMSIIDRRETSALVVAKTACRLLVIERDVMWQLIHCSHAVARNLLYTLSGRLRFDNEAIRSSNHRQTEFESLAFVDGLTGLHNRRWLDQAFRRQVERALHDGKPLTISMIDIDHFKHYNDTYGHLSGDRLLNTVALTLNDHLRPGDLLARFGGEEFAALLPDTDAGQALAIAERLRSAVAAAIPKGTPPLPTVTVSVGYTQMAVGDTLEKLLERADAALYLAKNSGRNCVRCV